MSQAFNILRTLLTNRIQNLVEITGYFIRVAEMGGLDHGFMKQPTNCRYFKEFLVIAIFLLYEFP